MKNRLRVKGCYLYVGYSVMTISDIANSLLKVSQLAIGLAFLMAGAGKILDLPGFLLTVTSHQVLPLRLAR